jgi:hypothetical protein
MTNPTLPENELKEYGILDSHHSFSKKMSSDDIQKFLQGNILITDNNKHRITFQLTENGTKLNINRFEREQNISEILQKSPKKIQYSEIRTMEKNENELNVEKKAFVYNKQTGIIKELDLIKNSTELTKSVLETKKPEEINLYKFELLKLKKFLEEKIEKFPEIFKEISKDLNIVDKEINSVNSISRPEKQIQKEKKEDIQLGINDPDLYEDANRHREENAEAQEEEIHRKKGMRR